MQKFPKTAIAVIVVVMGIATLQTMSVLSVQSAAAQPPNNQGQCQKRLVESEEFEFTRQQAHASCKLDFFSNQGECIRYARETGDLTEEQCKEIFSPPPGVNQ